MDATGRQRNPLQRMRLATDQHRPLQPLAAGQRAARFAHAVLARYAGRTSPSQHAGLTYLAVGPRVFVQQSTHRQQIRLALRLALSVLDWRSVANNRHVQLLQQPSVARQQQVIVPSSHARAPTRLPELRVQLASARTLVMPTPQAALNEQAAPEFSPAEIVSVVQQQGRVRLIAEQRMLQRLTQRAERIPMTAREVADPHSAAHAQAAGARSAPAVPRVLRRAAPGPDDAAHTAHAQRSMPRAVGGWPRDAGGSEHAATLDPFQIQRLADQVVQVIDNRVIARRERMGRI